MTNPAVAVPWTPPGSPGTQDPKHSPGCRASTRCRRPMSPSRRAVRLRRLLPAGRALRPGTSGGLEAAPALQPGAGGAPFAVAPGRGRRRRRGEPVRHRRGHRDRSGGGRRLIDDGAPTADDRRRPHDRAARCCGAVPATTARSRAALRRPPRHLGHLLRRPVHPRHPVPARREEGLLDLETSPAHGHPRAAVRQPDLEDDASSASSVIRSDATTDGVADEVVDRMRQRVGERPGLRLHRHRRARSGPRPGHRNTRSRRTDQPRTAQILRGLDGLNVVGADIVEVAPAYDHAEITGIAAAHVAYELLSVLARNHQHTDTLASAQHHPSNAPSHPTASEKAMA